ncbi:hypothetical protein GLOIN_2v1482527 [Rhizophagus irregularis DAOM 181602=DAOM 197198]|uniref:Uncharacterized protein n=2 Tax=Rhizophagus irregularis TaxID=588596 RepID=A0A2P4PLI6_RHIID|nr:hypothetical protein GLOIN_2v1482527 [Rhizophagus irregularis DAOM 181602=DAOM 197198]POG66241.1 hypothetical protein GLOIN_2v1482527 [Rhizophagus irregularis DAOM 181602=DAOM 197198]CAG8480879.1 12504_t:CDS:1 [Rhizophagus irregularis]|eukprot:XP_025173107.1 hypothetical protein GLOIN_2v1482527 [Rhizophagus irregularis DAOM 181602=DAOM 197198]
MRNFLGKPRQSLRRSFTEKFCLHLYSIAIRKIQMSYPLSVIKEDIIRYLKDNRNRRHSAEPVFDIFRSSDNLHYLQSILSKKSRTSNTRLNKPTAKTLDQFIEDMRPVVGKGDVWEEVRKLNRAFYIYATMPERIKLPEDMENMFNIETIDEYSMDDTLTKVFTYGESSRATEIPVWMRGTSHPDIKKEALDLPTTQTPNNDENSNELITMTRGWDIKKYRKYME